MELDLPAPIYRLYLLFDNITGIIRRAALLDPDLYGLIDSRQGLNPYIMFGVILVAAASLMLGRGVRLLVTKAPRGGIPRILINDGLRLLVGFLGAAVGFWLSSRVLLSFGPNLGRSLQFAAFAYAPLALSAFIALPRVGPGVRIGLYLWSGVVMITLLQYVFEASLLMALLCAAAMVPGRYLGERAFDWLVTPPPPVTVPPPPHSA